MLLSVKDIERLLRRGFNQSYFVKFDTQSYAKLKNRKGYCVFYDCKKRRCRIYADRPLGCRVYPVIVDEEKGVILDSICLSRNTVSLKEKSVKGKMVVNLLMKIDSEAVERRP